MRIVRALPFLAVPFLLLGAAVAGEAEVVDNPEYLSWSKFAVGAYARTRTTSGDANQTSTMVTTTKLVEMTRERLMLETSTVVLVSGQKIETPPVRREVPAKMDKVELPPATVDPSVKVTTKKGTEEVTVGGKKVVCETLETTTESEAFKVWSKAWNSADVPGTVVKTETKMERPTASTTSTVLEDFATK